MLISLRIENFALIDSLELEFSQGLNVLTGETGAGKSIILDAIDAALGGKLSARALRSGATRATVEATFAVDEAIAKWFQTQEIDLLDGNLVVCSREIVNNPNNTRSRSRLNGTLVNRQIMDQLREFLVEITAQGQTVQLGQAALQREWLDLYSGEPIIVQREKVTQAYSSYEQAKTALNQRRSSEQERLQRIDLLEYQLKELKEANLTTPDELEQLEQESQRLAHSVELQQQTYRAYQILYQSDRDTDAVADLLGKAEAILNNLLTYDPQLQAPLDLIADATAQIEEASRQISAYSDSLDTDPRQLEDILERIQELKQICRKYGPTLPEAIAYFQQIQTELETLTSESQSLEVLEQSYQQTLSQLQTTCTTLTQLRRQGAQQLESSLIQELKPLAMEKVQFKVAIEPANLSATGGDRITFTFSPNPGEPLQPLAATASGGEMSRFLLALKACFSQVDHVGTLVFDEIDAGVSGRVAGAIAQKLHQLSHHHQVLCVTHQPLVAAMADAHFRVNKEAIPSLLSTDDIGLRTVVRVNVLDSQQRRDELAFLTGGHSAQDAIAFAESLLSQAAQLRKQHLETPA